MSDRIQVSAKDKLSPRDYLAIAGSDVKNIPFMSFPIVDICISAAFFAALGGSLVSAYKHLNRDRPSEPKPQKPTGPKILIPPNIEMRNTKNKSKP